MGWVRVILFTIYLRRRLVPSTEEISRLFFDDSQFLVIESLKRLSEAGIAFLR